MGTYAAETTVTSDASVAEIQKTLRRYGAEGFMYGWDQEVAVVGFRMNDRQVKFMLPMPNRTEKRFTHTPGRGNLRNPAAAEREYEKAIRQRWRALALVVKAKLEAVESKITDFDSEFMAHIVLPDGTTAGEFLKPQIEKAYETGKMPALLPQLEAGK